MTMNKDAMLRRDFLVGAGAVTLAASGAMSMREVHAQTPVPNSSGTEPPMLKAPANACDSHMHIYDEARFHMPPSQRVPPTNAAVPQYQLLQRRIGTTRVVRRHAAQLCYGQSRHRRCHRAARECARRRGAASDRDGCGAETPA
jgi:hypothetical protein